MNLSPTQSTGASPAPLASLEISLNKIFLSVGDFLDFNSRTSSLGLDSLSRKPDDTARRTLDSSLQTFQAACDALEIQIVPLLSYVVDENRAKQVLRREIELLANPPKEEVEEKVEEVAEQKEKEQPVEETKEKEVKQEEVEEEMDDEEGLFSSEFDNLMDPNGFQTELSFGESMDWMNDV